MVDVASLLVQYGPGIASATTLFLIGRWLLRAQVVAAWIRVVGIIVITFAVTLLLGVVEVDAGRLWMLYEFARGVMPV